jgi:hypothetical protein
VTEGAGDILRTTLNRLAWAALLGWLGTAEAETVTLSGPGSLAASGPVTATRDGELIEGLRIMAEGTAGITVQGLRDVVVRNVEVHHTRGVGILIENADGVLIENVHIVHDGAPPSGANDSSQRNNILCRSSAGIAITAARLERGSSGVFLDRCPGAVLRQIEGYDFRGPFPRGQVVQFARSDDGLLEDFYTLNPGGSAWTEDNVNVWRSSNVTVRRGHIDGNNSPSGVGVIFEHDDEAGGGLVEDVDAIRMGNGCFSASNGRSVTFRRVRCRETICCSQAGRGEPLSKALAFHAIGSSTDIRYEQAQYAALCNPGNIAWRTAPMTAREFSEVDFAMREPVWLRFPWELGRP